MTLHLEWNVQPRLLARIGTHGAHRLNVAKCCANIHFEFIKRAQGQELLQGFTHPHKALFCSDLFNSQHVTKRMTKAFVTKSHFLPLLGSGNKGNKNVNFWI